MGSTNIYNKYPPEFNFGGKKVLNIGCGYNQYKHKNVVNVDAFDICKPDVVWDLNKTPYPFEDNSFDIVIANHILEHLPNWWGAFNECARVLKENGVMELWVPGSGTNAANGFRDHVVEINDCSFYGVHNTWREGGNAWADENSKCPANRMKLVHRQTTMERKWWIRMAPLKLKEWMARHLRNVISEDGWFFRKVTVKEHLDERAGYHKSRKRDSVIPLPQVPEAGVLGSN